MDFIDQGSMTGASTRSQLEEEQVLLLARPDPVHWRRCRPGLFLVTISRRRRKCRPGLHDPTTIDPTSQKLC